MTRAALAGALLILGGCTSSNPDDTGDSDTDTDTADTATADGCPEGMHGARDPGMLISAYRIDGLDRSPVFDDAEYQGRAAGCIAADGHSVDYLFLLLGQPYGRVFMDAPRGDESYDLNDNVATITIEIFGEPNTPTFDNGEWVTGTWFVSEVGATFDSDLNGTALDDDGGSHSLLMQFTIQGTR